MKLIKFFLLILLSFNISLKANSNDKAQILLKEGGKLIFIRHAIAPGGGDPVDFDILRCETQRNLSKEGIVQSKNIGKFFSENNIQIDKVLSSEWCRCKQTAKYAFNKYETRSFLNSFFSAKFASNKNKQIYNLKEYINEWSGDNNLVLVTHYVTIQEVLNVTSSSGELIITDRNFNVLARQNF
ncbi:histidine phosphatase family protein [Candidatus Pelagibacter sp.]|nr:histidine phosphatase family protein [Candidatus Pelagibacter sp.]MDA7731849.1 histidine phosphatase family protein [Candidatus Pelagibacter sp.]MDA9569117.1 histidine phosphatase family protein [Candidatus Pelagibacter sp.]MDC1483121.1 histidine phosphatase family protein [Pelagibacteraceae bacterium]